MFFYLFEYLSVSLNDIKLFSPVMNNLVQQASLECFSFENIISLV
jgi:hypothetical protein